LCTFFFQLLSKNGGRPDNKKRKYTPEFKYNAVKLAKGDSGAVEIPAEQMPPAKTLEAWVAKEAHGPAHYHRRSSSNSRRLLSLDQEHALVRAVIKRRERKQAVNYLWVRERIFAMKPGLSVNQVSEGYVSKLLKKHGVVSRRSSPKDVVKDTADYKERRDAFR
jgi:transposase-like protein